MTGEERHLAVARTTPFFASSRDTIIPDALGKALFLHLASRADPATGFCYESVAGISELTAMGARTVQRKLALLVTLGRIRKTQGGSDGHSASTFIVVPHPRPRTRRPISPADIPEKPTEVPTNRGATETKEGCHTVTRKRTLKSTVSTYKAI